MTEFNPHANIAKSKGIDLPILKVYLAGRICGKYIDKCNAWRNYIVNSYKFYKSDPISKNTVSYPISFLNPLNSGESESVDEKGLTSAINPNLIYDKDILSVERCDVLIANMDDFFEEGIKDYLTINKKDKTIQYDYYTMFYKLQEKILNRRPNLGTIEEIAIARQLKKPIILIVPENQLETYQKHPFQKRASVIVTSPEKLVKGKYLEILYKSIAGDPGFIDNIPVKEKFIGG